MTKFITVALAVIALFVVIAFANNTTPAVAGQSASKYDCAAQCGAAVAEKCAQMPSEQCAKMSPEECKELCKQQGCEKPCDGQQCDKCTPAMKEACAKKCSH